MKEDDDYLWYKLRTLYTGQKHFWQKYDDEWSLFEEDHVSNKAPIPHSAQFLLIHLIAKLSETDKYRDQDPECQVNSGTTLINLVVNSSTEFSRKETSVVNSNRGSQFMQSNAPSTATKPVYEPPSTAKMPDKRKLNLDLLEDAFKQAKMKV